MIEARRRQRWFCGIALAVLLTLPGGGARAALSGPVPPCAGAPQPAYPDLAAPPRIGLWTRDALGAGWTPPACTGWPAGRVTLLVAVTGRFVDQGDPLARLGAISSLAKLRYWSISDRRWERLYDHATAIDDAKSRRPRGDFTAAELRGGKDLYFIEADNRTGADVVYRLHVTARDPDHLVIAIDNVSAAHKFLIPLFGPGALRSLFFLDREPGGVWAFYSLLRVGGANPLAFLVRDASYANRAAALYREIAGLPAERAGAR